MNTEPTPTTTLPVAQYDKLRQDIHEAQTQVQFLRDDLEYERSLTPDSRLQQEPPPAVHPGYPGGGVRGRRGSRRIGRGRHAAR